MNWAGGARYCCPSLCCPFTDRGRPRPRDSRYQKEMLLSFRGCYSSLRGALTGSFLKSKDPGVLITVTTEKECRSKEVCVDLARNKGKQGIKSGLNQLLPRERRES